MNDLALALLVLSSVAHAVEPDAANEWRDRIRPRTYVDSARRNGLTIADIEQKREPLRGVIDSQNHWVIAPQFDELDFLGSSETLFRAAYGDESNRRVGVRDLQDQWVVQPRYSDLRVAPESRLLVQLDSKWGLIDFSESWILKPEYESLQYTGFDDRYVAGKNGKVGIVNTRGEWVIPALYSAFFGIPCDAHGFCRVTTEKGRAGLADSQGKLIVKPTLFKLEDFHEDLAVAAAEQGQVGVINRSGQWVVSPKFVVLDHFSEGLCAALGNRNGKLQWGYINAQGKWVLEPQFQNAEAFHAGQAIASTPQGFGIINKQGKWLRAPDEYTGVITFVGINAAEKSASYRIDVYKEKGFRNFNGRRNIAIPLE